MAAKLFVWWGALVAMAFARGGAVSTAGGADGGLSSRLETCQERVGSLEQQLKDERQENAAAVADMQRQIDELKTTEAQPGQQKRRADSAGRRRVQGGGAAGSSQITIYKRTPLQGCRHLCKKVDESNGGHRLLGENGGASCTSDEQSRQIAAINTECCNESTEDCSGGMVHSCNAGCSALITPFWTACQAVLVGRVREILSDAAALCPSVSESATSLQLMPNCLAGSPITDDCIPLCESETQDDLLQLTVNGFSAKLTCEFSIFANMYYWIDDPLGGYVGEEPRAFSSVVGSHAAGLFALTLSASPSPTRTAVDLGCADPRGQTATIMTTVGQNTAVVWTYTGSGAAFVVGTGAELQISDLGVSATSGLAFSIAESSPVMMATLRLQTGDSSRPRITVSCLVLVQAAPLCTDSGPGSVSLVGPLSISAQQVETGGGGTGGCGGACQNGGVCGTSPSAGNPACWSGGFTGARCCDESRGPTGDTSCWSGSFDFEFCCTDDVAGAMCQCADGFCGEHCADTDCGGRCSTDADCGPHGSCGKTAMTGGLSLFFNTAFRL